MTIADVAGKVVLVVGGAGGIGGATTRLLRENGAVAKVADLASVPAVDVTDPGSVKTCVESVVQQHGRLDAVVVASGLLRASRLEDTTIEDFDEVIAVNLRGAFIVAKMVVPHLRSSSGSLIFTGSTSSLVGSRGQSAYCAAKAAVANFARSLADELAGDGVRVNCVCPGWVNTPFNDAFWNTVSSDPVVVNALLDTVPLKRQASPSEIAPMIAFLCSDAASYITGATLVVDGGLTAVR